MCYLLIRLCWQCFTYRMQRLTYGCMVRREIAYSCQCCRRYIDSYSTVDRLDVCLLVRSDALPQLLIWLVTSYFARVLGYDYLGVSCRSKGLCSSDRARISIFGAH